MENQSSTDAQRLVEKIIVDNDPSQLKELTLNSDDDRKKSILASIRKLDMSPLSTPAACGG